MKKNGDYLIIGEIGIIGLAEACHLAAVFLKLPFTVCALLFAASLGILAVACAGFVILRRRHARGEAERKSSAGTPEKLLYGMFALMVISQLIFIGMGNAIYRKGDMMVETVGSLLASDSVYQVNPMTGMPYTEGMPLRLKILCLPTLYGSLCRWTGLPPALVVQRIVPMLVLVSAYVSFSLLGRPCFRGTRESGPVFCFWYRSLCGRGPTVMGWTGSTCSAAAGGEWPSAGACSCLGRCRCVCGASGCGWRPASWPKPPSSGPFTAAARAWPWRRE